MRSLLMAAVLGSSGCSLVADTELAEQAVPKFHAMLDAGEFAAIYAQSADDLRKTVTQEDFVALLEAVHRKLGNKVSTALQNWHVNYHTSGTFVTLDYATVYAEGKAAEQFVYKLEDEQALLAGYHINSTALILK